MSTTWIHREGRETTREASHRSYRLLISMISLQLASRFMEYKIVYIQFCIALLNLTILCSIFLHVLMSTKKSTELFIKFAMYTS